MSNLKTNRINTRRASPNNLSFLNYVKTNQNINRLLNPRGSNTRPGGVGYGYFINQWNKNPIKYVVTNSGASIRGIAMLKNKNRGLNLAVLATNKTLGSPLMRKIIHNARANNKNFINLNSVPGVINFYKKHGFLTAGVPVNGLLPMTLWLRTNRPNTRSPRTPRYSKHFTPQMRAKMKAATTAPKYSKNPKALARLKSKARR